MLQAKTVENVLFHSGPIYGSYSVPVKHMRYQNGPQSLLINLMTVIRCHIVSMHTYSCSLAPAVSSRLSLRSRSLQGDSIFLSFCVTSLFGPDISFQRPRTVDRQCAHTLTLRLNTFKHDAAARRRGSVYVTDEQDGHQKTKLK